MPKGVLWRNGDANVECFGGSQAATSIEEFVAEADGGLKALLGSAVHARRRPLDELPHLELGGGTVFVQSIPERLDPADIWALVERERLNFLLIVGDAFARPLLDELDRNAYDLSSLTVLLSGGAPLSRRSEGRVARPPADADDRRRSRIVGGRRPAVARVGRRRAPPPARSRSPRQPSCCRPTSTGCSTGRRRARLAGQERPARARLPRRRGQDGAHVSRRRRRPLRRARRPGPAARRRRRRAARPRLASRSTRAARRSSPRRSRRPSRRTRRLRLRGRRPTERALGQRGRRHRAAACRLRPSTTRHCWPRPSATSPATSCRRRSCSSTRSCARRAARPTTAGPSRSPRRRLTSTA